MSQQDPKQTGGRGEERVKGELRNLRKVQAPWYFESTLQQKLRMGDEPRSWVTRPVPAFALSLLAIALVGGVGYYFYINSESPSSPALKEESRRQPAVVQPSVAPLLAPRQQEAAPAVVPESVGDRHQGPSDQQELGRAVPQRFETETRPRESIPVTSLGATSKAPDTTVRQLRVVPDVRVSGVAALRDSVKSVDTSSARKDTTKAQRDSLQRTPQQNPPK